MKKKGATSAQFAMNSCKPANGVEYCYCAGQLCNSPPPVATTVTDDEDLVEGSGEPPPDPVSTSIISTSTTTQSTPLQVNRTKSCSAPLTPSLVPSVILILLTVWR
uniref:Uncharacterized protein n=1 Tax=Homalodisca liturata TaxID=320908 RepID=A0A1B6K6U7_9HEMI